MADRYDIDKLLAYAVSQGIDIAPDHWEWVKLCHALKLLGKSEQDFVQICRPHGAKEVDCIRKWNAEKNPSRYLHTEDDAKAFIVAIARKAGINPLLFSLLPSSSAAPTTPVSRPRPIVRQVYHIPFSMIEQMEAAAHETGLFKFLSTLYWASNVRQAFMLYHVGGSKHTDFKGNRATSFPFVNSMYECIDCRLQQFNAKTGSSKYPDGNRMWNNWALNVMGNKEKRDGWCLFGEHLLSQFPLKDVCIVESEKTAIICTLAYPNKLWLATSGLGKLTIERCAPLQGRKLILYPDRDGTAAWQSKADELTAHGFSVSLDKTVANTPGEPKDDIADIIVRRILHR